MLSRVAPARARQLVGGAARFMASSAQDGVAMINPATGNICGRMRFDTEAQVEEKLQSSQPALASWRKLSYEQRAAYVNKLAAVLDSRKQEFGEIMTTEMGKPLKQAIQEAEKCAGACRWFADNTAGLLKEQVIPSDASKSLVAYEPLGLIFQIAPFNFPFWQVLRFAAPALMAGNVTIVSHGHSVTGSAMAIASAFKDAGFPEGVFQTVVIPHTIAPKIIADRRVRGVTFTGSTKTGAIIGGLAGQSLKKSVLELGGSDAFVVLKDADIDAAVASAVASRNINNGQSCVAAKRFIVEQPVLAEFTAKFVEKTKALKVGDPMDMTTEIGPLARKDLCDNVAQQVARAVQEGARVACGGERLARDGFYYAPTVLTNVTPSNTAFHDEIFGPVASVIAAVDEADALRLANLSIYGLGGAVFTRDVAKGEVFARSLDSGMAFVNGLVKSDPRLPFGGVKDSGYGKECSEYGIKEWVNAKTLWIK